MWNVSCRGPGTRWCWTKPSSSKTFKPKRLRQFVKSTRLAIGSFGNPAGKPRRGTLESHSRGQPGLLGSWERFRKIFAEPIERDRNKDRLVALGRVVRPFILRRTKKEVLTELPPRTEVIRLAELSDVERKKYDAARVAALSELTAGENEATRTTKTDSRSCLVDQTSSAFLPSETGRCRMGPVFGETRSVHGNCRRASRWRASSIGIQPIRTTPLSGTRSIG